MLLWGHSELYEQRDDIDGDGVIKSNEKLKLHSLRHLQVTPSTMHFQVTYFK